MTRMITLFFALVFLVGVHAQSKKPDVILKQNGEEMKGKILEVSDAGVKFSYTGETVVYVIKKSDITKITFSSGRVETYNQQASQTQSASNQPAQPTTPEKPAVNSSNIASRGGDPRNKVAILPFTLLKDGQYEADELNEKAQDECFGYLNKHAGTLTIVDPQTTNSFLLRSGIKKETVKEYTREELCRLLSVEYIVEGTIMQNKTSQTNTQSSSSQDKTRTSDNSKSNESNKNTTSSSTSTSYTQQNFDNTVILKIFNDKGQSLYNEQRKALFASSSQDGYVSTLEYLLKRTPLYHK
jgi:hypothetical protein